MRASHLRLSRGAALVASICVSSAGVAQTPQPSVSVADQARSIRDMLTNPAIEVESKRQQQQNALVAGSVKSDELLKSTGFTPKLDEVFSSIRNGTHNVVSPDGEKIVTLIRSLSTAAAPAREAALRTLKSSADNGSPEALNFVGFATEYGLFGVKKNLARARSLYLAAGNRRYQPALYNTAVVLAYGRDSRVDLAQSAAFLELASSLAVDSSARVCGLGAFVDYRRNAQTGALSFAKGCPSPLATLAVARSQSGPLTPQTLDALRKSLGTGVDDGFSLIAQAARVSAPGTAADGQYLHCKYLLVDRYRAQAKPEPRFEHLRDDAVACYDQTTRPLASVAAEPRGAASMRRDQAVAAIAGFVPAEITALDALRKSNRFHYAWSVPYLPFTQQDVDLFEPLMNPIGQ